MDKYIGRLLDNRYEILEVIGTGGMAVVYKARCHRLNRLVAVKILKDDFLEDEEFRRRFHSESQAVAMLSHPNIVSVYDVSTSDTADYIVMELIDGITLKQYMEKKGVLNWKETLHFAIQIAKALEHAHSRGIVHRDIKPHNVMVLKNGSVKVTDFGIARVMSKANTLTKEALGSVHYISPEQAKGGRVDNRSDIYSLGVVMYEMMSGRPPYDGESPVAVAIQHINGGAAMPSTLNPNIPGGLEQIIMKAMGHEPAARFPSATALLADLDEFRKNPAMLFDYHTPPIDAVTDIPKPPLVLEPKPATDAEKAEQRHNGERRHAERRNTGAAPQRRRPEQTRKPANRRVDAEAERKRSNAATIAIISCSAVMLIAIAIFLVVLFGSGVNVELVPVPNLVGEYYDSLPQYENFTIKLNETVHNDTYAAGMVIEQKPLADEKVAPGTEIFLTVSLGPAQVDVPMPDLVGWEKGQAMTALNNLDMGLKIVEVPEFHDTVKEGCIIRTEPVEGTNLEVDQTVTIVVSAGKEEKIVEMDDLVGEDAEAAKIILNNLEMELEIVIEEVFDSEIKEGDVVKTVPAAGESLRTGQTVTLYISKGKDLKVIPDVLGKDKMEAASMLAKAGLVNYKAQPVESNQKPDTVVGLQVDGKDVNLGDKVEADAVIIILYAVNPTVTKDVTISGLSELTATGSCLITVLRDGVTVFEDEVPMGQDSLVIKNQEGSGEVIYEIIVGDSTWKTHKETF